ncbi:uncharacterized protein LOC123717864 [Pieris brassicae]|uniref:uncharacterized protein LOC123717864 n=1 Tax=Pieris brassicae TaxID=7116 RepID=UPI001E65E9E9|nr:uncharacterized protein LOC123717864 [Pieris brassicae]
MDIYYVIFSYVIANISAYKNPRYTIATSGEDDRKQFTCKYYEDVDKLAMKGYFKMKYTPVQHSRTTITTEDPYLKFEGDVNVALFGNASIEGRLEEKTRSDLTDKKATAQYIHFPCGKLFRAELVYNMSGVHLPMSEYLHRGYCKLDETKDYMQTAVNAFAIILNGDLDDIERLSSEYVLRSARTISMMKLPKEKLTAMWDVVKGRRKTIDISYETLEKYRPLFKYINGKEIARLNLSDPKILSFIGTHAELDRHQVGVIASKYISINTKWWEPRNLNLMNNILCGIPMTFMRQLPQNTFLQLSHQVFYHIHACDPLQRRFYLAFMSGTQVLGKSYSWSASDVAKLGFLMAEVTGPDLSSINPKSMAGITSKVMLTMSPHNLQYLTEAQLKYLGQKPLNILARKLKKYQDQMQIYENRGAKMISPLYLLVYLILLNFI